jgi:hypothetical protein
VKENPLIGLDTETKKKENYSIRTLYEERKKE